MDGNGRREVLRSGAGRGFAPDALAIPHQQRMIDLREEAGVAKGAEPAIDRVLRRQVGRQCEEAEVRTAFGDAAPLYRDAPEADTARASGSRANRNFIAEALPGVEDAKAALAADLIDSTHDGIFELK